MAKKQDFLSKTMKQAKHGKACPVCGEVYTQAKSVVLMPSEKSKSYHFQERNLSICKCNQKEVY